MVPLDSKTLIEIKVFAGRLKDAQFLRESSSGGAFIAISEWLLSNSDAIVCTVYNWCLLNKRNPA